MTVSINKCNYAEKGQKLQQLVSQPYQPLYKNHVGLFE